MHSVIDVGERQAPDENLVIGRIADEMVRVAHENNASGVPPFRRAAHAKHHGLVKADFIVGADIPAELRHGIFAEPRGYPAWIRFSNSDPRVRHDRFRDAHGMAIKLLNVPGEKLLESERGAPTHDLVLADHPVTFAHDAAEFEAFARAIALGKPFSYFFGGLRGTPHIAMFRRILSTLHRIGSPLAQQYWSQTAYRLGPHAVKYSATPASRVTTDRLRLSRDYLRRAMATHLGRSEASFDFLVQVRRSEDLPVEDATVEWSEAVAPFVKVATIRIPRQVFDSPDQLALGENLSFTAWHALPEHRPLGSINRTRRVAYETISRLRHERNGVARVEPTNLDVPPRGVLA